MIKKKIANILVIAPSQGKLLVHKDNPDVPLKEVWLAKGDKVDNYIELEEKPNE